MKRKRQKVSSKKNYLFFILLAVFLLLLYFLFTRMPIETRNLDVRFSVGDNLGVEVNNTVLAFGKIPPGSTSIKRIFISNSKNYPVVLNLFASKEVSDFLNFESAVLLEPGQNYTLSINLIVPLDAEYGDYSGKLRIVILK